MKTLLHGVFLAFLCLFVQHVSTRSISKRQAELDKTYVHLAAESGYKSSGHRIHKRSSLLEEIMGPLSRNVRQVDESTRSKAVYKVMRYLLKLLDYHLGNKPRVEIKQFQNWDKTIKIDQLFFVKPKTIFEVRRVINAARGLGMRVRATGAGHSRSPMYVDEGNIMMDVTDLERHDGPRMELHTDAGTGEMSVTVMTGVLEDEFNKFLTEKKVTLLAQPLNDKETIGGMVAVGTHGSTWSAPTYSGVTIGLRLMDANSELRKFTVKDNPELMKAVSHNLGMFGIMYDITLKVEKTIVLKVENSFKRLGDVMLNSDFLKSAIPNNFLTEISWFPFNSITDAQAEEYNKTQKIPDTWKAADDEVWYRTISVVPDDQTDGLDIEGPRYMETNGSLSGGNIKGLLRGRGAVKIAKSLKSVSYHYGVNAFPVILPPRWGTETSAAFILNVDNEFQRVLRAFQFLIEKTENQIKTKGTTPLNALLPRFFQNHDCYLCTGNTNIVQPDDSGRSLVIDFLAPPTQEGFYRAAADFLNSFKNETVRPHWAKRHDNIEGITDHIKDVYGNLIEQFQQHKENSGVDPCDMFMNSYLLQIFGRSSTCSSNYKVV